MGYRTEKAVHAQYFTRKKRKRRIPY